NSRQRGGFRQSRIDIQINRRGNNWKPQTCADLGGAPFQLYARSSASVLSRQIIGGQVEIVRAYRNRAPGAGFQFPRIILIKNAFGALDIRRSDFGRAIDDRRAIDGEIDDASPYERQRNDD